MRSPQSSTALALVFVCAVLTMIAPSALIASAAAADEKCFVSGSAIRFRPLEAGNPRSFFLKQYQAAEIERGKLLPRIVIQVINSEGNVDPTWESGTINATVASDVGTINPTGSSASIFKGEAHFTQLSIQSAGPIRLRFTAYFFTQPQPPFHNTSIETGVINVLASNDPLYALSFSPLESIVQHEGQPLVFVPGEKFEKIQVRLLTSALQVASEDTNIIQTLYIQASLDGALTDGTATLSGNVERLRSLDGVAVFHNLKITTDSQDTTFPPLLFNLTANGKSLLLRTGPLTRTEINAQFDNANIEFESAEDSWIYSENQELTAYTGQFFPPIRLSLRDAMYRPATSPFTGLIISATCDRAELYGAVVGVVAGVATFDRLTFKSTLNTNNEFRPFVLTFTAGAQGNLGAKGKKLQTGVIEVSSSGPPYKPAVSIRFRQNPFDSYFTAPNVDSEFSLFQSFPRPVQIVIYNGANQVDRTSTLSVSASVVDSKLNRVLPDAQFVKGVASFAGFQFESKTQDRPARMIFRTKYNGTTLSLFTGEILLSVQVIPSFGLQFQQYGASLMSRPGLPGFATKDLPLSPIVVEILSSVGKIERQSAEIDITASADGAVLSNNYVRSSRGVAIFSALTFVSETAGKFVLTFTAGLGSNTSVSGKHISSGQFNLETVVTPSYRIRFNQTGSYIVYEGQSKPISSNVDIPDIVVQLVDSTGDPLNLDSDSRLQVSVSTKDRNGNIVHGAQSQEIANGTARFTQLQIADAFDPVLEFCVSNLNAGTFSPAEGQCIRTGSLPFYAGTTTEPIAALDIAADTPYMDNLMVTHQAIPQSILSGVPVRVAVRVLNSHGLPNAPGEDYQGMKIQASSDYQLGGEVSVPVDSQQGGLALFSNLQVGGSEQVPVGVTPIITFSAVFEGSSQARRILPISTGLLTVVGTGGRVTGVDVVGELLYDVRLFNFKTWVKNLCHWLNIEKERVRRIRVSAGKGTDVDVSKMGEATEESISTELQPTWEGTRVEFQFLEPLPTSRNTKSAKDLAAFFVSLKSGCQTADLMLRRGFLKKDDVSCDWGTFDAQMDGARRCLESQGINGYCGCYVPMFEAMGTRCVGLKALTDLCLVTLIGQAKCKQTEIRSVCKFMEVPDASRTGLAASGAFLFLFLPPVLFLWGSGYFEKIARPSASKARIQRMEYVAADHRDHMT